MPQVIDIHQRGTRANQPSAGSVTTGTLYFVTDENVLEEAFGGFWVAYSGQPTTPPPPGTQILSFIATGGQVTWQSGYTYLVSASTYYILGTIYSSAQQTVTLDAADSSNDRFDVIVLNTAGTAVAVTGTAQTNPSVPTIDPTTQISLTIVSVPANSTTPGVSSQVLYAENAGAPAEWAWTTSGAGIAVNSATTPRTGTTCIRGTAMATNAYAQGQTAGAPVDINTFNQLVFYIRNASAWGNGRTLQVQWLSAGTAKGNVVVIQNGAWGFSASNTSIYQVIALDTILFAIPPGTLVNQIRIIDVGGSLSFGIDDVSLIGGGGGTTGSTGLSQAQADARYIQLGNTLASDIKRIPDLNLTDGSGSERITDQIFAGSNITITESSDSNTITIAAAAGATGTFGGGYPIARNAVSFTTYTHIAADFTTGINFYCMWSVTCPQMLFAYDGFASKTVKWTVWDRTATNLNQASSTLLDTGTIAVSAAGLYTVTFASSITFTENKHYAIGLYINDGTNLISLTSLPAPWANAQSKILVGPLFYLDIAAFAAGDAMPISSSGTNSVGIQLVPS